MNEPQSVLNQMCRNLASKLTVLSEAAVDGAFQELRKKHIQEMVNATSDVRAFVAMYESLSFPHGRLSPAEAIGACQQFLRGGAALTSEEILLVQRRANDWFSAWESSKKELADGVFSGMHEYQEKIQANPTEYLDGL